jgi:hypothetical protein
MILSIISVASAEHNNSLIVTWQFLRLIHSSDFRNVPTVAVFSMTPRVNSCVSLMLTIGFSATNALLLVTHEKCAPMKENYVCQSLEALQNIYLDF